MNCTRIRPTALMAIFCIMLAGCGNNNILESVKSLNYPSASGIEYLAGRYYIVGDDANSILITDEGFDAIDTIHLYHYPGKRIPKAIKPDLEAITFTVNEELLVVGSGSDSARKTGWLINRALHQQDSLRLDTFYHRLQTLGIKDLNIEGIASVFGGMVLTSRGHKNHPVNFLVVTSREFWKEQSTAPISLIRVGVNSDTSKFQGVSGIAYSRPEDRLILTVSTEDTRSATEDGAIGKSYLWIIDHFLEKKDWKAINPNRVIDLEKIDDRFKGHKIESVCITRETPEFLYLTLAADNDDGSSTLFRLIVEKN